MHRHDASSDRAAGWLHAAAAWLPRGTGLSDSAWHNRHRLVVGLLLAHAAAFLAVTLGTHAPIADMVVDVGIPALGALAATRRSLPRSARSGIAAVCIMLSSSVVVQLTGGAIEGHFHFFVMIPVVALYEDWAPFGLGVVVVLAHHGLMGTVDPRAVYGHSDAWAHPWKWAFIHAAFFSGGCIAAIANWRLHERARDVERALTEQMRHQALHDSLTGLPNRDHLLAVADPMLRSAARRRIPTAVLLIDLDRFKEINDVLGHAAGDQLLAGVAQVMRAALRADDLLARFGGDEFAALLPATDVETGEAVGLRILQAIAETIEVDGVALNVDASIGICVSTGDGESDIHALLRQADVAMYASKRGHSSLTVYEPELETASRERLNLFGELRRAVDRDQVVLHYQPKVDLQTRALVGVEALARWQHPVHGLLGPDEFIGAAEECGLIVPLTLHVLELALAQQRAWALPDQTMTMAVNLSPRCLVEPGFPQRVSELLAAHGIPPSQLELEITENSLVADPEASLATLIELDRMGLAISIDDFGSGYSSMAYLKALPVRELKVDRSFVRDMTTEPDSALLVRSMIDLGHSLGLTVVAEGVEDEPTMAALVQAGCDVAQGYLFSRPLPGPAMEQWRRQRAATLPRPRRATTAPALGSRP